MYEVLLAKSARLAFEEADASLQRKLDRGFTVLAHTPRQHNNIKPLKGRLSNYLRFRAGDYRIIYRIDDDARQVLVIDIAHRKDVYE